MLSLCEAPKSLDVFLYSEKFIYHKNITINSDNVCILKIIKLGRASILFQLGCENGMLMLKHLEV